MTTAHKFELPITRGPHLKQFIKLAWGVTIPNKKVCPNHVSPWRAFGEAYFAKTPVAIWKASRGFGGKSFLLALLGLTEAATLKCDVTVLGGSGEQSNRVHEHMSLFWNHESAPRNLLASDPSKRETRLAWGNNIRALMASQASVRGPHPQRLRLDEIDEMSIEILDAAMGQPMSKDGIPSQTVMSSTHQYADGTMTEVLRRAADKGWACHEWCWRETSIAGGWLTEEDVARKRLEVTDAMWRTEYDLQEPSPEDRAIQPSAAKAMFDKSLGVFEGASSEYIETEPPQEKATYVHGADWAKKKDWTVIVTMRTDVTPARVIAWERCARLPWPVMIGKFDQRIKRYGGVAHHDGTGLGDVVGDMVEGLARGVIMVGRRRSDMLSNYIGAIERGEIVSPFIKFAEASHRLASVDDVYGSGHLPDDVAAGALAWMGVGGGVTIGVVELQW